MSDTEEYINLEDYIPSETNQMQLERLGLYNSINYLKAIFALDLCTDCKMEHSLHIGKDCSEVHKSSGCAGFYCFAIIRNWLRSPKQFSDSRLMNVLDSAILFTTKV